MEYIGHSSGAALFVGEEAGAHTNLTHRGLSMLSNANLTADAYIKLNSCNAAVGGGASIAAGIANQLNRTTLAFEGPTVFSGSERARVTERNARCNEIARARGPLYLIEDRGSVLRTIRP